MIQSFYEMCETAMDDCFIRTVMSFEGASAAFHSGDEQVISKDGDDEDEGGEPQT